MARTDGKPAGWRFSPDPEGFWQKGDFLMCQDCRKQTAKTTPDSARHSPFCSRFEAGPVVRGPDLPPRLTLGAVEQIRQEIPEHPIDRPLRAQPKQGKPEVSDAYRQWCKQGVCCNCGGSPCDPHHEDTTISVLKRGVGQKARDTLCVSLCRRCHDALDLPGGGYELPIAGRPGYFGEKHDRVETLAILHDAQEERLARAFALLPQEWRIEALSAGLAKVPEGILRAAFKADSGDADERLAEALDSAHEEI